MIADDIHVYKCPNCLTSFELKVKTRVGDEIDSGTLICSNQHIFEIENGIPDFTWPKELAETDEATKRVYEKLAQEYEKFASLPFRTFKSDEYSIREAMIGRLNLTKDSKVLEIGCGDGRSSEHIVRRIGDSGKLYLQELSPSFLRKAVERLIAHRSAVHYSIANASYISFSENYFDAAHHFGGINTFSEVRRCLSELARVVKPGGKVVVGDEGIGPWLRDTEFGKIMINSNPLIGYKIPFELLPVEARDVKVEWIMMGAFFLIEFTVGEGEPKPDYHIPIPSERGGTHWTRYHGQLEGISDDAKKLAHQARKKLGLSMYQWLDGVVRAAASKDISD